MKYKTRNMAAAAAAGTSGSSGKVDDSVVRKTDDKCGKMLIDRFRQHRENGLYLDVTLKAGTTSIRAHKAFLAAFSDYFANLFGSGLYESQQSEIVMEDVDAASLSRIIEFAYSGTIEISPDTVESLLRTSDYLCIEFVREACCEYLVQRMNVSNVGSVLYLADLLNNKQLAELSQRYAAEHMTQLVATDSFLEIPPNLLQAVFSNDDLVFFVDGFVVDASQQESLLLDAVLRYVSSDSQRLQCLPLLLTQAVRLPRCPRERLTSLLTDKNLLEMSPDSVVVVRKALEHEVVVDEYWSRPRSLSGLTVWKSRRFADTPALRLEAPSEPFDDSRLASREQCLFVTGMQIRIRHWDGRPVVAGIKVFYNLGAAVEHGILVRTQQPAAGHQLAASDEPVAGYQQPANDEPAANLGNPVSSDLLEKFHLDAGERIIGATVRAGYLLDGIKFDTNQGRVLGPYGGLGGGSYEIKCPVSNAFLSSVKGCIDVTQDDTAVRQLELIWTCYKLSSEPSPTNVEPTDGPPRPNGPRRFNPLVRPRCGVMLP